MTVLLAFLAGLAFLALLFVLVLLAFLLDGMAAFIERGFRRKPRGTVAKRA